MILIFLLAKTIATKKKKKEKKSHSRGLTLALIWSLFKAVKVYVSYHAATSRVRVIFILKKMKISLKSYNPLFTMVI